MAHFIIPGWRPVCCEERGSAFPGALGGVVGKNHLSLWVLGWGALMLVGAALSLTDKRSRGMLLAAVMLFMIGFVARGSWTFQVEFVYSRRCSSRWLILRIGGGTALDAPGSRPLGWRCRCF
jgi:hypothetical protein